MAHDMVKKFSDLTYIKSEIIGAMKTNEKIYGI